MTTSIESVYLTLFWILLLKDDGDGPNVSSGLVGGLFMEA